MEQITGPLANQLVKEKIDSVDFSLRYTSLLAMKSKNFDEIKNKLAANTPFSDYINHVDFDINYAVLLRVVQSINKPSFLLSVVLQSLPREDLFYHFIKTITNNKTKSIKPCALKNLIQSIATRREKNNE